MNQSKISVRYAKAFFEYAEEKGTLKKVIADVKMLSQALNEIAELKEVFNNPIVKPSKKKAFVNALLKGKVTDETIGFLNLIIDNAREMYVQDMLRNVIDIYRRKEGITAVTLTSATALSKEQEQAVIDFVTKKENTQVELQTKIDASIMGGFVLRIEDVQYDASIKTRLKQIKNELIANK